MKKGIIIVLSIVFMHHYGFCQDKKTLSDRKTSYTVEQFLNEFSEEEGNIKIKLGGFVMFLSNLFTGVKGVSGVEVYSFDECKKEIRDHFNSSLKVLKDNTYETLVSTTENGVKTKILVKTKEKYIKEIVIISGGNDPSLVRIKGKIKPETVKDIINNNKYG